MKADGSGLLHRVDHAHPGDANENPLVPLLWKRGVRDDGVRSGAGLVRHGDSAGIVRPCSSATTRARSAMARVSFSSLVSMRKSR